MLSNSRVTRAAQRVSVVAAGTIGLIGLVATGSAHAATDHFTCRGSAIRVLGLPSLNTVDAEPSVANAANDPCRSDHVSIANAPSALANVLDTSSGVSSATTTSSAGSGRATATVADPKVLASSLDLTAKTISASAGYGCSNGMPVTKSTSKVVDLRIAGGAPITASGPVTLPDGDVADVALNETSSTFTSITRRAVDVSILDGVDAGVHVVLGEATAGVSGGGCAPVSGTGSGSGGAGGNGSGGSSGAGNGSGASGSSTDLGPGTSDPTLGGGTEPYLSAYPPEVSSSQSGQFAYRTSVPTATLQCSLDGSTYTSCSGTTDFQNLPTGTHSFAVRQVVAGAAGPAAEYEWKILHNCPGATGSLHAITLGQVRLGMTRKQATHAYTYSSTRGKHFEEFFCVRPEGVRVGFASTSLLKTVDRSERKAIKGRVVLELSSNHRYSLRGVRPGASLATAERKLGRGHLFYVGKNDWYLAYHRTATAVVKVRNGQVKGIGLADPAITKTRREQRTFIRSFS